MRHSRPLAKDRALRALAEGAKPSLDLLADVSGRSLKMLRREAERDGWRIDENPLHDYEARIAVLAGALLERMEEMAKGAAEDGGRIVKTEIDGMIALVRGIEKICEIMRPMLVAKENKNDEDLAEVLDRINERIIELAEELAKTMVETGDRPGGGGTRSG